MSSDPQRLVVLISGNGSNLQALIDSYLKGTLPAKIVAVISNQEQAYGLERARHESIPTRVVHHKNFGDREAFDHELMQCIDSYAPDLVVLAGFLRILTPGFVQHYAGRLLNIHPSLLPHYPGLNTHDRALQAGETEHGASVHFVTEDLDGGPVILQARVPVKTGDDAGSLARRVLEQEHLIYPLVVKWFVEGHVRLQQNNVVFDGKPLSAPFEFKPAMLSTLPTAE